jgi:thymidylate synthase
MENGVERPDRTDVGTSKFVPGYSMQWDLAEGFPILTTRRVSFRIAFEETMFFLRGDTDTTKLEEKKINIWKGNTSREFLDSKGLNALPVGSLGAGYSHQWRNFNGVVGHTDTGVDQVRNMINEMQTNPTSRRHVITAWNPEQVDKTPLPPCHLMHMYTVDPVNKLLHSSFVMRSNDVPFGLPYNIMSYAYLNHLFSRILGLTPGTLSYFAQDAHIYKNQYKMVEEQLTRTPRDLPMLGISKPIESFDDALALEYSDIQLVGYDPYPDIADKPGMAV